MSKTTVIYHSADFDGLFCREIARKFLPDAEFIGWDFGNPPLVWPEGTTYVLDLPVDRVFGGSYVPAMRTAPHDPILNRVIWIDHHKSAIETHPEAIAGYRIDGVAACRLAWQWFLNQMGFPLPSKQDFIDRTVSEPWAVRLAGEYDIWDRRDPDAELFQHGLRSRELTVDWSLLLTLDRKMSVSEIEALMDVGHVKDLLRQDGTTPNPVVLGLLENGRALQYAKTEENTSIIKDLGFTFQWEGLTWLACNHARYNSHLFTAGLKPEHDACFGFKWTGRDWSISLYHAPGKEHHDLSLIAVKHGGGGHKGACGMRLKTLPFLEVQSVR